MTDATAHNAQMEQDALDYLRGIEGAYSRMRRLEQDRAEMRTCIDQLKAVRYDRVGAGGGMQHGDDAMAAAIERLEAIDAAITEKANLYAEAVCDWTLRVRPRLDSLDADILHWHYIDHMEWETVASMVPCSERMIYNYRWAALLSLYQVLYGESVQ